jgi:hypothetical protein
MWSAVVFMSAIPEEARGYARKGCIAITPTAVAYSRIGLRNRCHPFGETTKRVALLSGMKRSPDCDARH